MILAPIRRLFAFALLALATRASAQDWSVSIAVDAPAAAEVGDFVGFTASIAADAGADNLTVNDVHAGATTTGVFGLHYDFTAATIAAGSQKNDSAVGLIVAPPGSAGVHAQVEVDGTLGAAASVLRTASTRTISVLEGVVASLSGAPKQVRRGDSITYSLDLTSNSDTDAELSVPHAAFDVPPGTSLVMRTDGSAALTADSSTHSGLVVTVSNAVADGAAIVMTPGALAYSMSAISLPSRAIPLVPASMTSVAVVPIFVAGFE